MNNSAEVLPPLLLEERRGVKRINEPVTVGLPFSQGSLTDAGALTLWDDAGRELPVMAKTLARWFDGSIKWLLLDFQANVDANSQAAYRLQFASKELIPCQLPTLSVQESADELIINTGKATFFLNRELCKPLDRVLIDGSELIVAQGTALVLTDQAGQTYLPELEDLAVEVKGSLRVTIVARGVFRDSSRTRFACFVVRLIFYAGADVVQMQTTVHNPNAARHPGGLWDLGDEGSIYFKDLSLHVPLSTQTTPRIAWTSNFLQPLLTCGASDLQIYQDSSGGENWRSTNHVNRFGEIKQSFRGYCVSSKDALLEEGFRATPILALHGERSGVAASIDKFWQNFPKAMEAHGNEIRIRLFPHQFSDVFELQGGEQKTYTIYLQFFHRAEEQTSLAWVHDRLVPRVAPEWYANSKACSYLSPTNRDTNIRCRELIDGAIAGSQSFFTRREIIDEYGWRHFGDLYADHEAVGHSAETPLVSHYNNQYDVIYGAIVEHLRGGNPRWLELASDLARHVIDIDIYHTREDRAAYNGGLFWHTDHYLDAGTATHRTYSKAALKNRDARSYGGGPSNEQNYTSGLLHYYYLTGDEMAREAVLSLADWVLNMDEGSHRPLGFIDNRPTGLCSSTVSRDYHGPGRGAANSINSLLDAYMLTRTERYLAKAEELVRRCIHPNDDISSRNLNDPEHRWSYLVFLQILGKYLDVKIEKNELDFMYCYAQASLLHYAEWMIAHEVPYSTVLDKVDIPTETWPAQDVRKSAVFHVAAKHADGAIRGALQERADFFFERCIEDLSGWETCTLTRPLALLLATAYVHAYFQQYRDEPAPQPRTVFDFGRPKKFSPQFQELFRARKKLSAWVGKLNKLRQAGRSFLRQNKTDLEMHHG